MRHVYSAALAAVAVFSAFAPSHAFGQGPPQGLSITNYQLVSEQRVTGNQSYFTYRADLVNNNGSPRSAVTATVTSNTPNIQVQGLGNLHFGAIAANGQITSQDTVTFLINKSFPTDFTALSWTFTAPVAKAGPNQSAKPGTVVTLNG